MAHLLQSSTPWTEAEREIVRAKMNETYDLFAARVKAGRPDMDLATTAQGRLFTGATAVENHMADHLGGLQDAILGMAADLKLDDGDYDVLEYPGPASLAETIGESFGAAALGIGVRKPGAFAATGMNPVVEAIRALVGERQWPAVRDSLGALIQLRDEPVLLASPRVIIVR
jgi:ClpP class serine protease